MARRSDAIDTGAMRNRVRDRHLGGSDRRARGSLGGDLYAISCMERVVEWARRRGITVCHSQLSVQGIWNSADRTITIEPRLSPTAQLYVLLHECGHMLIDASASHLTEVKFGGSYEKAAKKTVDKVNIVAEEFEAWNRGWLLAERLDLKLSKREFDKRRTGAVKSYMEWALSLKRHL